MNNLNGDYRFSVAPMMGVTTPSARYMYRLISKEAVLFTEMIASQALHRGDYKKLLRKENIERPVILQVGGSDKKELSEVIDGFTDSPTFRRYDLIGSIST